MKVIVDLPRATIPDRALSIENPDGIYLQILTALGNEVNSAPLGIFLAQLFHLKGSWVVLSPICWRATHNDAMIIASGFDLDLDETSSRTYFEKAEVFIKSWGMKLFYVDALHWLMQCPEKTPFLKAKPPKQILHHSLTTA